jgi:hypothetical protein
MSLSMPNSWRIDTFMSGSPTAFDEAADAGAGAWVASVIDPPWSRNTRDPKRFE